MPKEEEFDATVSRGGLSKLVAASLQAILLMGSLAIDIQRRHDRTAGRIEKEIHQDGNAPAARKTKEAAVRQTSQRCLAFTARPSTIHAASTLLSETGAGSPEKA